MKRRQLLHYGSFFALGALAAARAPAAHSAETLSIRWLGHTCFLLSSSEARVLVNPFRTLGCTAGYRPPQARADYILISSRLLDEGAYEGLPGRPKLLFKPGDYRLENLEVRGIEIPHDDLGGRRFGQNLAWKWKQAGMNLLHLGGAAAPITLEQRILMGKPDVLFVPVGGGPKAFEPEEAVEAIAALNPKLAIPTHYRTLAADDNTCDLSELDVFLDLASDWSINRTETDVLVVTAEDLPETGTAIQVLQYDFNRQRAVPNATPSTAAPDTPASEPTDSSSPDTEPAPASDRDNLPENLPEGTSL